MQSLSTKPIPRLTPRQLQILKAISKFRANQCYSPTIGELAGKLGISRSTVFEHIAELRKKDLLLPPQGARSLKPTSKAQKLLKGLGQQNSNYCPDLPAGIPLAGTVAAGIPIEAIEAKEHLSLNSCFPGGDNTFALEVTGNSMVDEDIRDGDYVLVERSATARDGQIIVALLENGEATLKKIYRNGKGFRLEGANENFQPLYVDRLDIQGVVIGVVRRY